MRLIATAAEEMLELVEKQINQAQADSRLHDAQELQQIASFLQNLIDSFTL